MTAVSRTASRVSLCLLASWCCASSPGNAQAVVPPATVLSAHTTGPYEGLRGEHLVVPQRQVFRAAGTATLQVTSLDASVSIVDQAASTTLRLCLHNSGARATSAEILLPVPRGAVVREFAFDAGGTGAPAVTTGVSVEVLEAELARKTYEEIVRRLADPALLEFADGSFVRSSVFPVPAGGDQRLHIVYDELLPREAGRIEYVLPRSSHGWAGLPPWSLELRVKSSVPLRSAYSPSHPIQVERLGPDLLHVSLDPGAGAAADDSGSFRLAWLPGAPDGSHEAGDTGAAGTVYACPRAAGGGTFLLLVEPPLDPGAARQPLDLTLVIDRSGSMRGEKLEQVREAARQLVEALGAGDAFNLVDYAEDVHSLYEAPRPGSPELLEAVHVSLDRLVATGGTNLHGALLAALGQPVRPGALPLVLFLTDGLPTVGIQDEATLREHTRAANTAGARLFTFGVGHDVNAPLLDRLAEESGAESAYVHPTEDVEVAVGTLARRLVAPVLTDVRLEVFGSDGQPAAERVSDLLPARLGDLRAGEQLVLLGLWFGDDLLRLRLSGQQAGVAREVSVDFDPGLASRLHGFVPRLWAERKVAALVDAVRQSGATPGSQATPPWVREAEQEIVALASEFGILTEYTAFLAKDGADLSRPGPLQARIHAELQQRARAVRTGRHAVSQAVNLRSQRERRALAGSDRYLDADLRPVRVESICRINGRTLFLRQGRWVDARILRMRQPAAGGAGAAADGAAVDGAAVHGAAVHGAEAEGASAQGGGPAVPGTAAAGSGPAARPPERTVTFGSEEYFALVRRLVESGGQAVLALEGDLQLLIDGEVVTLLRQPPAVAPADAPPQPAAASPAPPAAGAPVDPD